MGELFDQVLFLQNLLVTIALLLISATVTVSTCLITINDRFLAKMVVGVVSTTAGAVSRDDDVDENEDGRLPLSCISSSGWVSLLDH